MCSHGTVAVIRLHGRPVGVDSCIANLVLALNQAGLDTVASCCGHGHRPGSIMLRDGRELLIMPDRESARAIDHLWPDIHGHPLETDERPAES